MKLRRSEIHNKFWKIPEVKFEDQTLTSFSGLVIFQKFLGVINFQSNLRNCFSSLKTPSIYPAHKIFFLLIIHILIGFRKLRDLDYHRDDPLILRVSGLKRIPDVSTISRILSSLDDKSFDHVRDLSRNLVIDSLKLEPLKRITLDFDGSVLGTSRFAEGSAIGFNKKKKGQRSYYPLFATVAQTGQIFDVHHRSGNVHDSNGALEFIQEQFNELKTAFPKSSFETRMDSAFFNENILLALDQSNIEFTISVPFERFPELKNIIEKKKRWKGYNDDLSFSQIKWKPKKWNKRFRLIVVREVVPLQRKEVVQLDLFIPYEYGYKFKVIVTNKKMSPKKIMAFHNGRGNQENTFSEIKSQCQMDYVPFRKKIGNQMYLMATIITHNLGRHLQILTQEKEIGTTEKRSPHWVFQKIGTFRKKLIQKAGRLTKPKGKWTLSMGINHQVQSEFESLMKALDKAA